MRSTPSAGIATTRNPDPVPALARHEPDPVPGVAVGAGTHKRGPQTPDRLAADPGGGHQARWVAVIGPPAVGKTTITGWAAAVLSADVFRLREFADRYR